MSADVRSEPTDEEILAWVVDRFGDRFAHSVRTALTAPATSQFADAVRRALIREMRR